MAPSIRNFRADASLDKVLRALAEDGAAGICDVISPALLARIDAELAGHVEAARARLKEASGAPPTQPVRVGGVIAKSPSIVPILQSSLVHKICERFLLPHCSRYRLSGIQLVEVQPGSAAGRPHRDDVIWPLPGERPLAVINFLIPLTDFVPESGATRIAPGSHRWRRDASKVGPGRLDLDVFEDIDPAALVAASLGIGSMLPVLGGTIHAAGANRTGEPRRALSLSVALGWLRQEENMYLSVPQDLVAGLPEDIQQFIGYGIHEPYLGHCGFD